MPELLFKPESHEYFYAGDKLPSVTNVISPVMDYSKVNKNILGRAATVGTFIHKAVALWAENNLDESSISPGIMPHWTAFKKLLAENPTLMLRQAIVEKPIYHSRLLYAGTPDLVIPVKGGEAIIDIKSREFIPRYDVLQLLAYEELVNQYYCKGLPMVKKWGLFILSLLPDESYQWHEVSLSKLERMQAWGLFRELLEHYKGEQRIARLVEAWKVKNGN